MRLSIKYTRVKKIKQEDETKFLHEAKISDRKQHAVGIGLSAKAAKQDSAVKMVFILFSNSHKEFFEDYILRDPLSLW